MDIISLITTNAVSVFAILATLGLAVGIHEFGHMIFMLVNKVPVESFAIGFGPRIVSWNWGGIDFSIRWLPLGGFVKPKIPGSENTPVEGDASPQAAAEKSAEPAEKTAESSTEQPASEAAERTLEDSAWDDLMAMEGKGLAAKLMVFGGGVFMNLVIAIVAMAWFLTIDKSFDRIPFVLDTVPAESMAADFGFEKGDKVVAFNGQPIRYFEDFEELSGDYYASQMPEGKKFDAEAQKTFQADVKLSVQRGEGDPVSLDIQDVAYHDLIIESFKVIYSSSVIGDVIPASPAARSGLKAGDRIVAINGQPTESFNELSAIVRQHPETEITVDVDRKGESKTFKMKPNEDVFNKDRGQIGIIPYHPDREITEGLPLMTAIAQAPSRTINKFVDLVWLQVEFFRRASFKQIAQNVGGPVMISVITAKRAQKGFAFSLDWFITFNLLLIFFNLLPIPVLDGGFILIAIIESISRRPIPRRFIEPVYALCMYMIIGLMITIVFWDFWRAIF